jgi:hypothetical protein
MVEYFLRFEMNDPIIITSDDARLQALSFKPFRSNVERRVIPFMPEPEEAQSVEIETPWGSVLTAKSGDFLISELETPNDFWPIDAEIFEESYELIRPGYCVKRALVMLTPLTDLTADPDAMVSVVTLEGTETVRAGDFYLAVGVKGEVWPYPKEKVEKVLTPAD